MLSWSLQAWAPSVTFPFQRYDQLFPFLCFSSTSSCSKPVSYHNAPLTWWSSGIASFSLLTQTWKQGTLHFQCPPPHLHFLPRSSAIHPHGLAQPGSFALWLLVGLGHWEAPEGCQRAGGERSWGIYPSSSLWGWPQVLLPKFLVPGVVGGVSGIEVAATTSSWVPVTVSPYAPLV